MKESFVIILILSCCVLTFSGLDYTWGNEGLNKIQAAHEALMELIKDEINTDDGLPVPTAKMNR